MTVRRMVLRSLTRNPFRVVATLLAVAVSMLAFALLRTVVWSWTVAAEHAPTDRLVTRNRVTFFMPLARRYVDELAAHARELHVARWTHATWFVGKDPLRPNDSFASVAVDADTYFDVYDEAFVAPDQLQRWKEDRRGAVVGVLLAKRMGWKIGDRVRLESGIFPDPSLWEFTIDGVYDSQAKNIDRTWFLLHWAYVNDALPAERRDMVGWISSRVDDPSRAPEVAAAIDRLFETSDVQTLTQDERVFHRSIISMMSAVLRTVDVVSVVLLVIMTLVVGNTIALSARERMREYGVLFTIGFRPRRIAAWVVAEAVLVSASGGVLGLAGAYLAIEVAVGPWLEENVSSFFHWFRVSPSILAATFLISGLVGALAAAIPAWSIARLRAVDVLRRQG